MTRTGSTRSVGADVGTTIGTTTALRGAKIETAARCGSRSHSGGGALVSNNRMWGPDPVARPGRLRISIEKERMGRFKCVLDYFSLHERIARTSATLRGEGAAGNMRMLLNEVGKAGAHADAVEPIPVGDWLQTPGRQLGRFGVEASDVPTPAPLHWARAEA